MTSSSRFIGGSGSAWLRPSAVEGWRAVSRQLASAPHEPVTKAVGRLKASYSTAGLDFAGGTAILEALGPAVESAHKSYQLLIEMEARRSVPTWLTVLPRGRLAFRDVLTADVHECFRRAGAFSAHPTRDAVEFLDRLANMARAQANLALVESGRTAERKSFDLEVARCATISGAPPVEWVALDDNSAGFDIRSSRCVDGQARPKLIEVKSCRSSPLQMIVTRHEWQTACRNRDSFVVHLWDIATDQLHELSWEYLQHHMPVDQGNGHWDNATLILRGLHAN
ncbi:DUF3883 domain-containing protein [Paraburkholderia denitrificans]|uniref:DUF3883 domain-containing protein n=1 Tax=Paraburkholderia denitrificans TaxID=694025 RepID=A0ABW0J952_9BURK